jgi:hypothetical protein
MLDGKLERLNKDALIPIKIWDVWEPITSIGKVLQYVIWVPICLYECINEKQE